MFDCESDGRKFLRVSWRKRGESNVVVRRVRTALKLACFPQMQKVCSHIHSLPSDSVRNALQLPASAVVGFAYRAYLWWQQRSLDHHAQGARLLFSKCFDLMIHVWQSVMCIITRNCVQPGHESKCVCSIISTLLSILSSCDDKCAPSHWI